MPKKEDAQRKLDEARRKAEEEEAQRLEEEVERQAESLRRRRQKKKEGWSEEEILREEEEERKRKEAENRKKREEEERKRQEEESRRKQEEEERRRREEEERKRKEAEDRQRREEEERRRQEEERRRQEEEARRKREEEERRHREEEERKWKEEEARKRREEEERKRKEEETRRRREEEERRRKEEEARRGREEEERQRREEEQRRREEEKQEERRRQTAKSLKKAETHLSNDEFDKAQAEVESILASDPMQAEALALDEKIRAARDAFEAEKEEEEAAAEPETTAEARAKPPGKEKEAALKPRARRARRPLSKGVIFSGIGVVIAVVVGITLYQVTRTLFEGKRHIAVFPLTSQANTDEERTLGTGLAHEVATLLAYIPNTRILGPATASNLSRTTRNPRLEANRYNFDYTVRGTIGADGNTVTINVEILDTLGGKVWTDRLSYPASGLMTIASELATSIAEELALPLPQEIESQFEQPPTRNSSAYLNYLRGRELLHRDTYTSTRNAARLFQQAAGEDPRFAEAHAAAAYSLFLMYESNINADAQTLTQGEDFANKATGMRQPLAEADVALGGLAGMRGRYAAAVTSLQRALEHMPNNSGALRLLGVVHAIAGNESKAIEYVTGAYDVDPANADILTLAALVNERFGKSKEAMAYFNQALPYISDTSGYLAGIAGNTLLASYQYERAIALYEKRVAQNPGNYVDQYKLARAYQLAAKGSDIWSRAFEKTIALIQKELRTRPGNALAAAYLGLAYSRYGQYLLGEASGKRAMQFAPNDLMVKYKVANIYGIQKKKTEAIAALSTAIKKRYLLEEIIDLDFFNIRQEPEFIQTISLPLD